MPNQCEKCKKDFKYPWMLKRHLHRKKPCKKTQSYQIIPEHTNTIPNNTNIIPNNTKSYQQVFETQQKLKSGENKAINDCKMFLCKYCKSDFTNKNSVYRHINELRCSSIPILKQKSIEKRSQSKALHKKQNQIVLFEKNVVNDYSDYNDIIDDTINVNTKGNKSFETICMNNTFSNNTLNNIKKTKNNIKFTKNTNNNTNNFENTNNIINNNFTIKINPLGQENTSFLTKEDKIRLLERMYNGVPELIKTIHSHPENRNFFLPNINKNIVAYLNDNNEIQYDNRNEICQQIIDNNIDRLDDFFYEFKNDIKSTMKDRIEKIIDKNQENSNHDKYFNEVNLFLLKISKKHRKDLNVYLDKLEQKMS